jgi:hypothetical protein
LPIAAFSDSPRRSATLKNNKNKEMIMIPVKRFVAVGVAVATIATYSLLQPCTAKAGDEGTVLGDLAVSQIAGTPARADETTVITFSIENAGSDRVLITGLHVPGEEPGRIMGFLGQGHSGEIGSLPVRPGATETLDGRKLWIEVGPLTRDLEPDTTINARLVLGTYETPLLLHIGPIATGSTHKASNVGVAKTADHSTTESHIRAGC